MYMELLPQQEPKLIHFQNKTKRWPEISLFILIDAKIYTWTYQVFGTVTYL